MEMPPISDFTPMVRHHPSIQWFDRSGPLATNYDELLRGIAGAELVPAAVEKRPTDEEALFVASADAKIWASKVAMKLPRNIRDRLFRQLDMLHDPEEWMDGKPIRLESFQSLVRSILVHKIRNNPALALMPTGNCVALWLVDGARLTVEFRPGDMVRWAVQIETENGEEKAAGLTALVRLREVLEPYGGGVWFLGS